MRCANGGDSAKSIVNGRRRLEAAGTVETATATPASKLVNDADRKQAGRD